MFIKWGKSENLIHQMSIYPYHSAIFGKISTKLSGIVQVIPEKVLNYIQPRLLDLDFFFLFPMKLLLMSIKH